MDISKKNDGPSVSIDTITKGDVLLYRLRKVHKVDGDPSKGFKPSIELAEYIDNDKRPVTAVAAMNSDDDRFAQEKPQHAFQPVDLAVAIKSGWITDEAWAALSPSKGVDITAQEEGKHFITVNKLNPTFDGKRLRVQILETTETNRKGVRAKINPKTGATVLVNGKPVYRIAQVAFEGNHKSHFLSSDNTTALFVGHKVEEAMNISENTKSENLNA